MLDCVYPESEQSQNAGSLLCASTEGVTESPLIGLANSAEKITAGKMAWPHGFHVRRLDMEAHAGLGFHSRSEEEVFFIQSGDVEFQWEGGELQMSAGDVITVPIGMLHGYRNTGDQAVLAYVVRGGNSPAAPSWQFEPTSTVAS